MTLDTADDVRRLSGRIYDAWCAGDAGALGALLTDDFRLVGPLGFVLARDEWLGQHRSGALVTHEIAWEAEDLRVHGDCAVAIGTLFQKAEYRGQPADGQFRATMIAVRRSGGLRLAGMHLSPIARPPSA